MRLQSVYCDWFCLIYSAGEDFDRKYLVDVDSFGMTSLMQAADRGDVDRIITLVASGEDSNFADEDGWTAIMFAADNGHVDSVRTLARLKVTV